MDQTQQSTLSIQLLQLIIPTQPYIIQEVVEDTYVSVTYSSLPSNSFTVLTAEDGTLIYFGGSGYGDPPKGGNWQRYYMNDVWGFNVTTSQWALLGGTTSVSPTGKYQSLNVPYTA